MVNFKNIAATATALFASGLALPHKTSRAVPENAIEGSYIVTLKSGDYDIAEHMGWVDGVYKRNLMKRGLNERSYGGVGRTFSNFDGFRAYTGEFDDVTIAEIEGRDDVISVEHDFVVTLSTVNGPIVNQTNAPWGLAAISEGYPGAKTYSFDEDAGANTFAYVVDSGVMARHEDFEGRVEVGYSVFKNESADIDTLGHGSHVAGTSIGRKYGVAKKARAVAVKVFQGRNGSMAKILEGFDWAVEDILSKDRQNISVINLSLGGGLSFAFNEAVADATAAGILTVAAAGNDAEDSSLVSPASAPSAITVGAVDKTWARWNMSNYGEPVDIYAPGVGVLSVDISSDTAASLKMGTSMAAPHVAGMALYAMSVHGITGPKAITKHILENGLPGVVSGALKGSANLMANLGEK